MIRVIGVRFRTAGKIYFFDPLQFEINRGDHVIVETARGIEFGTVVSGIKEVEDEKVIQPLKPVIRIATERDCEQEVANKEKEKEAFKICLEKIRKHELEMKLIDAEYTFDNNKVLFYFTADGRIDFRELVKDLASVFKTRIELRQIGVRDETKILGGIGICGRPLCCHSYLSDFIPVSIKMAKEQNLSLNPTKISGVCGRLMCCLKNEEETYEELNRRLPNVGDYVTTEDGYKGEVQSVNVLRQLVKVIVDINDEKEIREYEADKLSFKRKGKKEKMELSKEELKELERLEREDLQDGVQELEERKPERKFEGRQDRRSDSRNDGRQDNRQNHRQNNRQDNRNNGQEDRQSRGENRNGSQEERPSRGENRNGGQEDRPSRGENRNGGQEDRPSRGENRNGGQEERPSRGENRNGGQEERPSRREHRNSGQGDQQERQENRNNRQEGGRGRYDGRHGRRHDNRPRRDRQDDKSGRKAQNHDNQSEK